MSHKKEVANKLKNWLMKEKMFKKEIKDAGAYFNFQAEYQDIPFHVLQPKNREDMTLIICDLILDEKQRNKVKTLKKEEQTSLLRELQYQMLFIKGRFQMILDKEGYLEKIRLWDTIYYDGLTKDKLMETTFETIKSFLLTEELITRIFQLPISEDLEKRQVSPPFMYA